MIQRPPAGPEAYSAQTRAVAARVDPQFDATPDAAEAVAVESAVRDNKFSRELLPAAEQGEGATEDAEHRRARSDRLDRVTDAFNDAGVEYATMKNLRAPKAMMSDLDLLIPDPGQQSRAVRVLARDGFEFYRFRLLAHPRKFMAKQSPGDPRPVDVYPDAIWIRKKVCDADAVVDRAASDGIRRVDTVDDLYLVATHAHSHLSVTFAELFHGVSCLDDGAFDWERLARTARQYGTADALGVYLRLLDEYLRATGRSPVPDRAFEALDGGWMSRLVERWWRGLDRPRSFPVSLPLWLPTVASSAYHVPKVARRATPRETLKDLQSHYLTVASKTLLGKA